MSPRSSRDRLDELTCDRERRLLNQRAFPLSFVSCSCPGGCVVCAYTGLVSRAESKQLGQRGPAVSSPRCWPAFPEGRA